MRASDIYKNFPVVMGILNVTPDSFSDGGLYLDEQAAVEHALQMFADGAGIVDVGPESSRPGSKRLPADEQIARAVPVIRQIRERSPSEISIDTYDAKVADAALQAGAGMVNDISGLSDPDMIGVIKARDASVVIMHMQGTPETMQKSPDYTDVVGEVKEFLLQRAAAAVKNGIPQEKVFLDPGIGFGKRFEDNIELMRNVDSFVKTGFGVLIGTSRKGFLGTITGRDVPADRDWATASTVAMSIAAGAAIVRVHNVKAMVDVAKVASNISPKLQGGPFR